MGMSDFLKKEIKNIKQKNLKVIDPASDYEELSNQLEKKKKINN